MKKKAIVVVAIVVVVAIAIGLISMLPLNNQENELSTEDVILKKNVSVITSETTEAVEPYKIDENHLYFKTKPDLKKNEVVVSGITEVAPAGFMRKIVSIKKSNGEYVAETTQASFADVFKEVDFQDSINLSESTTAPTIETQSNTSMPVITHLKTQFKDSINPSVWSEFDNIEIEYDDFTALVNGTVDFTIMPKLVVTDNNMIFDITWDNIVDVYIDFFNAEDINETIIEDLTGFIFYPREFYVGNVPVVITNRIGTDLKFDGEIKGNLSARIEMNDEIIQGFSYNSKEESYSQMDETNEIDNNVELTIGNAVASDFEIGLEIKSETKLYDGMSIENLSCFKTDLEGDVKVENLSSAQKDIWNGSIETAVSADNKVVFTPGYPLCEINRETPVTFEREDVYLWNDTALYNGPLAPSEAWIASQFYKALDFYERNIYGRNYRVSKLEQPTAPLEGAILFNGEWLAPYPYTNFHTYEDFVEQCSEYFKKDTVEAIRHSMAGEDYKGAFYSRFHWGIGDIVLGDTYQTSIKELGGEKGVYYYVVYINFEDLGGEQIECEMYCHNINGEWIFESCAFYGKFTFH